MALGGIDEKTISRAKALGFNGAATLGYLWNNFEKNRNTNELNKRFNKLKLNTEQEKQENSI